VLSQSSGSGSTTGRKGQRDGLDGQQQRPGRHRNRVFEELEDKPKIPAGDATKDAGSEVRRAQSVHTRNLRRDRNAANPRGYCDGRYWARTSDLRLVEAALSQLS
jgi:hypothetical protein